MGDSYIAGLLGELISGQLLGGLSLGDGDDDDLGDLVSGRIKQKRAKKALKALERKGYTITAPGGGGGGGSSAQAQLSAIAQHNPALAAQIAAKAQAAAYQMEAGQTGIPQTAGSFLAPSSQRKEPVNLGTATLAIALGSPGVLSVTLQRAMQAEKLVLQAADATLGTDMLFSVGITNAVIGSHNLFSTPGSVGAATSFARDSWETNIMSVPLGQGGSIRVDLIKITATTNATIASGTVFGTGAQG